MFDQADRNGQGSHLWPSSEPALVECRTIIKRPRSDICNINSNNNSNHLRPKCRSTISTALGLVAWCLLISFHLRSNGHITSNGNHCRLHQPLAQLALSASLTLVGAASSSSSSPSSTSILQSSIVSTNGGGGDGSSGPSSSLHVLLLVYFNKSENNYIKNGKFSID
ncbi:hypothetical protein BLOT_005120 [Blomia tropicalis]|nr:hypothetical protein BLOT_005120 [Blomia tropicalis]